MSFKIQRLPLSLYKEPTPHGYRFFKHIRDAIDALQTEAAQRMVVIGSDNPRRLMAVLDEQGIPYVCKDKWYTEDGTNLHNTPKVHIIPLPVNKGYRLSDAVVFAESEILGPVYAQNKSKTKLFRQNFDVGDYVVHKKHGIGQFLGLEKVNVDKNVHECLKVMYAGQQRLYVPIELFDDLSRYGDSDMSADLDELGSLHFQKRKAKAKQRINEMCQELLQIAAKRKLTKAPLIDYNQDAMDVFVKGFKFVETQDQLLAIQDVLTDLSSGNMMDRIVCGDAGFGKTEVALRAICATVNAGYQIAILTPTTTLCHQHYLTLKDRFDPKNVVQLSRLVPASELKKARENIANGRVNIIVGTTALLSDQLKFKKLGLLIVDEEHHFGVKQKEKIKKYYPHVHTLSLSATPIPRTLQLSLAGVKDLSILGSPPFNRKPITTFAGAFDAVQIQQALHDEMERQGQAFWILPHIQDMDDAQKMIKKLAPHARICKVHGRMDPEEIANVLIHFSEKKYDVMLATSIIEAGVDLPGANTLIIQNAHLFGLAQLYQMRGRVGRSDTQAFAFLTYPEDVVLTPNAIKRLNVVSQLDKLGIGFTLATQDMDIRGYGNLVGSEQSGHVSDIGIELYQDLLEATIQHMSSRKTEGLSGTLSSIEELPDTDVEINLNTPVYIPEDYIDSVHVRLDIYNRIAFLKTREELVRMKTELEDRFGPVPQPVMNLLEVISIKQLCRSHHISKISTGPTGILIAFHVLSQALVLKLSALSNVIIRNDKSIVIKTETSKPLAKLQQFFKAL